MSKDRFQARSKKDLADLARKKGISGWHGMRKEELIAALSKAPSSSRPSSPRLKSKRVRKIRSKPHTRPQHAAARNTNGSAANQQQGERSKYDVGVATKDLAVKVPKDL